VDGTFLWLAASPLSPTNSRGTGSPQLDLEIGLPVVATSSMEAYQSGVGIATTYDGPIPAPLAYAKV